MTLLAAKPHLALRLVMVAAYAAAVLWIIVRAGEPDALWWWIGAIPFLLWIVSPIAVPLLLRMNNWLLTSGVTAMAAYGIYVYGRDMFGPDARSTSALIFVFLPLYQWLATAILIAAAVIVSRRAAR